MKEYIEIIETTEGIHALVARNIVHSASKHNVEMFLEYDDSIVDAKSILGLMSLGIPSGKNVKLIAKGRNAEVAIKEVIKAIN